MLCWWPAGLPLLPAPDPPCCPLSDKGPLPNATPNRHGHEFHDAKVVGTEVSLLNRQVSQCAPVWRLSIQPSQPFHAAQHAVGGWQMCPLCAGELHLGLPTGQWPAGAWACQVSSETALGHCVPRSWAQHTTDGTPLLLHSSCPSLATCPRGGAMLWCLGVVPRQVSGFVAPPTPNQWPA